MSVLRKIKQYFKRKEFKKRCLYIPCTRCPYFFDDGRYGKCKLAISLGLEEV